MQGARCGRRIGSGVARAEEGNDRRPNPLWCLARVGHGRVPDHSVECMCLGTAPIIRFGWDKISRGDADLEHSITARDIYGGEQDQRNCQRQNRHPTHPDRLAFACQMHLFILLDNTPVWVLASPLISAAILRTRPRLAPEWVARLGPDHATVADDARS